MAALGPFSDLKFTLVDVERYRLMPPPFRRMARLSCIQPCRALLPPVYCAEIGYRRSSELTPPLSGD